MADRITRDHVLEAVRLDPRNGFQRGKLQFFERMARKAAGPGAAQLLEYVQAKLAKFDAEPSRESHRLPWVGAMKADPFGDGPKVLGASDVLWLSRLPTEPAKVSDEDASRLASLALAVAPRSSDAVLLDSIFGPVRRHHERLAAVAEANNARRHLSPVEAGDSISAVVLGGHALGALAAVYEVDEPGLHPDEAHSRAAREVREVVAKVKDERAAALARAEAQLERAASGAAA